MLSLVSFFFHISLYFIPVLPSPLDIKTSSFFQHEENVGFFLQFADIHFQNNYVEGTNPDCDNKKTGVCCFEKEANQTRGCGKFGFMDRHDSHNYCDIPRSTFQTVADFLVEVPSICNISLSSIVFSGDIPDHGKEMEERMGRIPAVKFFPVIGNHDSFPRGDFDFPGGATEWIYENFTNLFTPFLSTEELKDVRKFGCYNAVIEPGLRIVTLNSNLFCPINPYVKKCTEEQMHMMANYLEEALLQASLNNEKVIISEHIGIKPDQIWVTPEWVEDYQSIVKKYSHVIVADISGHYHLDYPQAIIKDGEPVGVQLVMSSVPPWGVFVQPAFRIFKYDKKSFEMLDYVQIYNELDKSNADGDMKPHWNVLYTAREEYNLQDLSPKSWFNFLESMTDDEEMYLKFEKNYHVDYIQYDYCPGECKKKLLCSLKTNDLVNYNSCIKA